MEELRTKVRPCENILADFCTPSLLKAQKLTSFTLKKANGEAFRSAKDS